MKYTYADVITYVEQTSDTETVLIFLNRLVKEWTLSGDNLIALLKDETVYIASDSVDKKLRHRVI